MCFTKSVASLYKNVCKIYDSQYYDYLLDEILDIIKDIPHYIIVGLKYYHKIIYN